MNDFLDFLACFVLESSVELGEERTELSHWLELIVKNEWFSDFGVVGLNMSERSLLTLFDHTDRFVESDCIESESVSSFISMIICSCLTINSVDFSSLSYV